MLYKRLALVSIALILLLASCQRSADPYPLPTSAFNTPLDSSVDPMKMIEEFATATALAREGLGPIPQETPTPEIGFPVEETSPIPTIDAFATMTEFPTLPPVSTPEPILGVSTPFPVTAMPGTRPATYVLQRGEFPYCIARRFDVNPDDLLNLNKITHAQAYSLQPGWVLQIPQSGSFPGERALRPHPTTYTVVSPDETLYSIACLFGDVDPLQIAQVNGLSPETPLTVGQVLNIP